MIYLIPGFPIVLEAVLTVVLIALIGAAGYIFFVYSMKDDRNDKIARLHYNNPWDKINNQAAEDKTWKPRRKKGAKISIILLIAAIPVLILLILEIN